MVNSVAVLLQMYQSICAKKYENNVRFDEVIAKIIRVQFFASQYNVWHAQTVLY